MTVKEENINLELVTERFNLPEAIVSWNTPLGSLWVSLPFLSPGKKQKNKKKTGYKILTKMTRVISDTFQGCASFRPSLIKLAWWK